MQMICIIVKKRTVSEDFVVKFQGAQRFPFNLFTFSTHFTKLYVFDESLFNESECFHTSLTSETFHEISK